jgi:hypothetical protein
MQPRNFKFMGETGNLDDQQFPAHEVCSPLKEVNGLWILPEIGPGVNALLFQEVVQADSFGRVGDGLNFLHWPRK